MKKIITAVILFVAAMAPAGQWCAGARTVAEGKAIENVPVVSVEKGFVELTAPEGDVVKFEIFSITGQLVKSVTVKSSTVKVDLPKGFYIIKCENWTKRVMLK